MTPAYAFMLPIAPRSSLPSGAEEPVSDTTFADLLAEVRPADAPDDPAQSWANSGPASPIPTVALTAAEKASEDQAAIDGEAAAAEAPPDVAAVLVPEPFVQQHVPSQTPPMAGNTEPFTDKPRHPANFPTGDGLSHPHSPPLAAVTSREAGLSAQPVGLGGPSPAAATDLTSRFPGDGSATPATDLLPPTVLATAPATQMAEASPSAALQVLRPDPLRRESDQSDNWSGDLHPESQAPKGGMASLVSNLAPPASDNPVRSSRALAKFANPAADPTPPVAPTAGAGLALATADPQTKPADQPGAPVPKPNPVGAPRTANVEIVIPGAQRAASPQPAAVEAALRLWMGEMSVGPKPATKPAGATPEPPVVETSADALPAPTMSHQDMAIEDMPADATHEPGRKVTAQLDELPREPGRSAMKDPPPPTVAVDATAVAPSPPPPEVAPPPIEPPPSPIADQTPIQQPGQSAIPGTQSPTVLPPAQQIAGALVQLAMPRPDRIELVLAPEELGRLRFDMTQHGESLHVVLSAERPETLDLLRRSLPDLLAELRQAGIQAGSFSFSSWSEGGTKPHGHRQDRQVDAQSASPSPPHPPLPRARPQSGLDLRF